MSHRQPVAVRKVTPLSNAQGPVAQWLEPAAHNGLVAGSSPAGPTNLFNVHRFGIDVAPEEIACKRRVRPGMPAGVFISSFNEPSIITLVKPWRMAER